MMLFGLPSATSHIEILHCQSATGDPRLGMGKGFEGPVPLRRIVTVICHGRKRGIPDDIAVYRS